MSENNRFSLFEPTIYSTFCSANERVAIDFKVNGKNPGFLPDGMTIDTEGNLYVAAFGRSKVLKVDPK